MRLLLPLLLMGAAVPAAAQSLPPRRFYAGAEAIYQRFNGLAPGADVDARGAAVLLGPLLRAGYRLTPRLALEAGLAYGHRAPGAADCYGLATGNSSYFVPLRLRYGLLPKSGRWQVEVVAGLSYFQQTILVKYDESQRTCFDPWVGYWAAGPRRDLPVLLGAAGSRRLGRHWQAVAQAQLAASPRFLFDPYAGFEDVLPGLGGSAGVQFAW